MVRKPFCTCLLIISAVIAVCPAERLATPAGSQGAIELALTVGEEARIDSLIGSSRYLSYRIAHRLLERFFDSGDSVTSESAKLLANRIAAVFGDPFYLRQFERYRSWREEVFRERQMLKRDSERLMAEMSAPPTDQLAPQFSELADRFLSIGDSVAAAICLQNAGYLYGTLNAGDYATSTLAQALQLDRSIGNLDGTARSYNLIGKSCRGRGDFLEAGVYFDSARIIKTELADFEGVADCLNNIAATYLALGERTEAKRFANEALRLRIEGGDSSQISRSYLDLILAFGASQPADTIRQWLRQAEKHISDTGNVLLLAYSAYGEALLAEREGNYSQSAANFDRALQLLGPGGSPQFRLSLLVNRGRVLAQLGEYDRALSAYARALTIARGGGYPEAVATLQTNIGEFYHRLGHFEDAREYYEHSLALKEQMKIVSGVVTTAVNLADLYLTTGDLEISERYLGQSRTLAAMNNDLEETVVVLTAYCRLYQRQGNYAASKACLDSVISLRGENATPQQRLDLLCLMAEYERQGGNHLRAESLLTQAAALVESEAKDVSLRKVALIRGLLRFDQQRWHEAATDLRRAIAGVESVRQTIPDIELRIAYHSNARYVLEKMALCQARLYAERGAELFLDSLLYYGDAAKVRGLLDLMAGIGFGASTQERVRGLRKNLEQKLDSLESYLVEVQRRGESTELLLQEIRALNLELAEVQLRNTETAPAARLPAASPRRLNNEDLRRSLSSSREAILSYLLTPEQSLLVLITQNGSKLVELPSRDSLTRAVARFSELIQLSIKDESLLDAMQYTSSSLAEIVFGSQTQFIFSCERIYICPDAVLNLLPFEALLFREKYLVEQSCVVRLPSLQFAHARRPLSLTERGRKGLAVADPVTDGAMVPLPISRKELIWLENALPEIELTVASGESAVRSEILQHDWNNFDLIHFATHSTINYRDPGRSRIWLSADTTDEGSFFTLSDIFVHRLNAELVVLSSCESAGGRYWHSEGLEGFVQGFLSAGAKSIIVSLWEVEDFTTGVFMKSFYEQIGRGSAEALCAAKSALIASPRLRHRHPYHWAPFILIETGIPGK